MVSGHAYFYAIQCASFMIWWVLVFLMTRRPLHHAVTQKSCCVRPSWLPARYLLFLRSFRTTIFSVFPILLAMGALYLGGSAPPPLALRVVIALSASAYHLCESSATNRHGEYPLLYNSWGMVLPAPFAQAVALGVAVHFIFASGAAKLCVGGFAWLKPQTMRVYLDCYYQSSKGPLYPGFNRWLAARAWATSLIAVSTIAVECVFMPGTLFLPPAYRITGLIAMVGMHVGIALSLSAFVGIVFLTTLPSYIVGFSCAAPMGSAPWCLAAAVALLPSVCGLLGRLAAGSPRPLFAEDWPISPISLFMWNGEQAQILISHLMKGNTRVVLSPAGLWRGDLVGSPVVHHGDKFKDNDDGGGVVVTAHDAVLRVIGFTLIQGQDLVGGVLAKRLDHNGDDGWDICAFLENLENFLGSGRVVQTTTGRGRGEPLLHAHYVRIKEDGSNTILEVLQSSPLAKKHK